MFIIINNDNLTTGNKLETINKKLQTSFELNDFKKYNNNYILNVQNDDLDYQRDVNQLQRVFVQKLFKKDVAPLITYAFLIFILLLQVISLSAVNGTNSTIIKLTEMLQKALG